MSKLKIVSWNCCLQSGAFTSDKQKMLMEKCPATKDADIFVIQECYYTDAISFAKNCGMEYHTWYCDGKDSCYGIGVFSKKHEIKLYPNYNSSFRYVVPYYIGETGIVLLAVWTKGDCIYGLKIDGFFPYDENLAKAVEHYKELLSTHPAIIIGDFNTFAHGKDNAYESLRDKKLPLFKDAVFEAKHEIIDTYYDGEKYHYGTDDFCFVSKNISVTNAEVDNRLAPNTQWDETKVKRERWRGLSDHCPIIVELGLEGISLPSDSSALPLSFTMTMSGP